MTARIVGVLFILAMASSILSGEYLDEIPDSGFSTYANENKSKLQTGSLFLVILAIAVVGIPVLMYPILKTRSSILAKLYIVARAFEGAFDLIMASIPLRLSSLSTVTPVEADQIGASLIALNDWSSVIENIPYCIGAIIFYFLLNKMKLVPRWLSLWGMVGAVLFLGTVPFRILYTVPEWVLVFAFPLVLNEMVLAVWLIVKGFNYPASKCAVESFISYLK